AAARAGPAAIPATKAPVMHARLRTPRCANRDLTSTMMARFTPPATPRNQRAPPVSNWTGARWGRRSGMIYRRTLLVGAPEAAGGQVGRPEAKQRQVE